jgi:rod shape-determining protein MreB
METAGHMIVDIGGGTTEIAIIPAGDIAYGISLKIGGDDFTDALSRFVRRKYNIELGELSAEDAKIEIAGVFPRTVDSSYEIKGKSQINGLPVRLDLGANETVEAFEDLTNQIIDGIMKVLEQAETELIADVGKEGILLSGGGSLIYGMDKLINAKTGIKVTIADEPESVVAAGAGMAGEYIMVQDEENK